MVDTPDIKKTAADANILTEALRGLTNQTENSVSGLSTFIQMTKDAGSSLGGMIDTLKTLSTGSKDSTILLKNQADIFNVLAVAALGATKAFDNFGDQKGLNTFSSQVRDMVDNVGMDVGKLTSLASKFGINIKGIKSVEAIATAVKKGVLQMAEGADSALKLQNGFLQLSAAGGNFGQVLQQSGPHLTNLNNLLQNQAQMLDKTGEATLTNLTTTISYYEMLGKVPGYLNANISSTDKSGHSLNMLAAAMKLAHGTGQTFEAVMHDLTAAYESFGAEGDKALKFTASIADLSQKYGVTLGDVSGFMIDMGNSFRFASQNADSSTGVFNRFFGALKESGLSVKATIEIMKGLEGSMEKLGPARRAFLSQQTGGPGGLMGAAQLEKELRDQGPGALVKRVEQALKQQFGGRIVSLDEATRSQSAAQQFTKQKMFLQQGPFGSLVDGEAQATKLLAALSKPGGYSQVDAIKALQKDITAGTDIENKSSTALSQANIKLDAIKMFGGITALALTQKAFTPATQNEELRRRLQGGIINAMGEGREATKEGAKLQQEDKSALYASRNIKELFDTMQEIGVSMSSAGDVVRGVVSKSTSVGAAADVSAARTDTHKQVAGHEAITRPTHAAPLPENITVNVVGVCPDCHKKFPQNPQKAAINGAFGPGF